jgi:ADP-dependent NAD(P)H-hydrate dehydratase
MNDLPRLAPRRPDAHKGDFGLAVIVAGSRGMSGAAALAGMSALRGGAGLVRVATPDGCAATVAGFEPSYMTVALPSDRKGRIALAAWDAILAATARATVVACGPGLGRSPALDVLVSRLYVQCPKLLVIDADGLNALSARPDVLEHPGGPRILTPHPGEFARLLGRDGGVSGRREPTDKNVSPREEAVALATRCRAVVVLKGHRTLVTDGRTRWTNTTGNPGMATGGTGDVLTGLIAALACQRLSPLNAARLGVYLHGLAGDLAAAELGQESLAASDLIRFLPHAFAAYRKDCGP